MRYIEGHEQRLDAQAVVTSAVRKVNMVARSAMGAGQVSCSRRVWRSSLIARWEPEGQPIGSSMSKRRPDVTARWVALNSGPGLPSRLEFAGTEAADKGGRTGTVSTQAKLADSVEDRLSAGTHIRLAAR